MTTYTKTLLGALSLMLALTLCTGCRTPSPAASSLPPAVNSTDSGLPGGDDIEPESTDADSGITASFPAGDSSLPSGPSGQSGGSGAPVNGSGDKEADFKEIFDSNAIDRAMAEALDSAEDARSMAKAASSFADIWETEVGIAHKKAQQALTGSALKSYEAGQKTWSGQKESALAQIQKEVREEGGSDAAMELSLRTAEFYRGRVYDIYLTIYLATGKTPALTYNGETE